MRSYGRLPLRLQAVHYLVQLVIFQKASTFSVVLRYFRQSLLHFKNIFGIRIYRQSMLPPKPKLNSAMRPTYQVRIFSVKTLQHCCLTCDLEPDLYGLPALPLGYCDAGRTAGRALLPRPGHCAGGAGQMWPGRLHRVLRLRSSVMHSSALVRRAAARHLILHHQTVRIGIAPKQVTPPATNQYCRILFYRLPAPPRS